MPEVKEMVIEVKKYKYASLQQFKIGDILVIRHATPEEKESFLQTKKEQEEFREMKRQLKKLATKSK